ncbi:MAG: energy transducer TonB [Acidobacteriota bacterium]|nr:energy transducer TonB [Acidobacteriota bacterium]
MPSLETPPNDAQPTAGMKVRSRRYGELDEHELLHLLDSIDDEVSRARFRESIYISVIICMAIAWFVLYGPQVIFHQPRLINPADVLRQRELTYLDMPKDSAKDLRHKPTNVLSDKDRTQQTAHPTLDQKTLAELQAMRRAGAPGAESKAPAPTPAPQPQQALPSAPQPQQQQTAQQPQQQTPAPLPQVQQQQPSQQAMVEAPHAAPTRPNFGSRALSPGDAIRQAAQAAASNRGQGGDYGASIPVAHQGLNTGVDILSDTQGVNFDPYLRKILREIYNTWLPLIPEEARPPLNKQGITQIRFVILPDGHIGGMWLDGSTHDDALNRAAWGSITGVGQFPPLPSEFHGPNLELRIHYLVNRTSE